ncbi:hypothetical protein B0I35DRAFT_354645 [Stachybotrys elegans]|uniref:NACHT domain-containing protein n=1 Tax=Stachybotrys elegans TaxID=80388 RepID=A0A8K0SVE2_9HYPO|nr:hypothetical protein B0I35DRAFT_354645 [Stachybotrys elegans]
MATKRLVPLPYDEHQARPHKRPNVYDESPTHDEPANHAPTVKLSHEDYTIAWICALHLELAASRAMLDEVHEPLPAHDGDHNAYVLGRIAKHNVVMVALPMVYGKVNAAAVSTHLKRSFPNIKATLMVGIGGGAPGEANLYLGDVVVGIRVMEYDLGKAINDGDFQCTAVPKLPSPFLLSAAANLRSKHGMDQSSPRAQELMRTKLSRYSRPTEPDRLFQASYPHPSDAKTCDGCDASKQQPRLRRSTEDFLIHYGVVASGDSVNKDVSKRDMISRRFEAICFEMEAAGIMDSLECLPIRGICDYSDSHKNKASQDYAAATAASYARELLETIPSLTSGQAQPIVRDTAIITASPSPGAELIERRECFLGLLDFPQINARKDAIRAEQGKTCRWFLTHPKYLDWIDLRSYATGHSCLLWIRGKAGAGKSTLMKFLHSEVKKRQLGATVVSFFFNARGAYLEKSITGMYRSLLKQILTQFPDLQRILDQMEFSSTRESACPNLNGLKELFQHAIMALGRRSLICFIDALDECNEDDVRDMVHFFSDLTESATEEQVQFRVCFSSRPYPYIHVDEELVVTLENETGHSKDLEKYVQKRLQVPKKSVRDELQGQILGKASGVFMWVVLVVEILNKEAGRGGLALRRRLSEIPPTLSQLFKDILTRDQQRPEELRRCILWVLCAHRPLTPSEFCHAMWAGGLKDDQVDDEIPDAEDDQMNMALASSSSKGLVEVTKTAKKLSTVQFIHESVRDFLIKERGLQELWPDLSLEWEGPSHEILRSCCEAYLMHPTILAVIKGDRTTDTLVLEAPIMKTYALLEYASQHILDHANKAARSIAQEEFLARFFRLLGTEAMDRCQSVKIRRYGPTASQLYVLADKGLENLIPSELESLPSTPYDRALHFGHPLFAAMANNHKDAVARLLGLPSVIYEGENLMEGLGRRSNMANFRQRTPMSWAAQEGRFKLVQVLARNGHMIDIRDAGWKTPLQRAADNGHTKTIQFLLDNGANVNKLCFQNGADLQSGSSPSIDAAAGSGHLDIVEFLADKGANLDSGLRAAADKGHLNIVEFLLDKGADDLNSGLRRAAMRGHLNIVELLVDRDADPNCGLVLAAEVGHLDIVEFLAKKGADIHKLSLSGSSAQLLTPLIAASRCGHIGIVRFLLGIGADLNGRCMLGRTAQNWALAWGRSDVAVMLEQAAQNTSISAL